MAKFSRKTAIFGKKLGILIVPFLSLLLTSCYDGKHELKYYTRTLGVDFISGEVVSYEDNHGGFLGDGFMLCVTKYSDNKVENKIKSSSEFKAYPLSKNLSIFLYGEEDEGGFDFALTIPKFENGYFYFYNRHDDAKHKNSDEDLFDTVSFNFTFILYNCDSDLAYFCEYDT